MGGGTPLVGRQEPLGRLQAALDSALGGRGGVVLVAGEPGIGKSAVLGALAEDAADRSVDVVWGQCWDDSMAPAFWPWTQVLRELGHGTDPLTEGRLSADTYRAVGAGSVDRFELFDAVRARLMEVSEAHGLVVVLEDLHWADEATLALLSFLARHVPRSRVLIVGGFRDIDASTPLVRLTGSVEVLTLTGLADEEAAHLADAVAAGRLATDRVVDVVRRAGGNPLFVRELTRLVAAGRSSSGQPVHVPGGVRELVAQRLARLSPACRAMLDIAAVAGPEVRLDVLARTVSRQDNLPDLIDEAVRARILVTSRDELAPLGFAHDLFREALAAMLSPAIKAQLHLTLARTLDNLRADGIPIAHASVAAHYVAAASLGLRPAALQAVRHSQQAALDAAGQLAFEDAAGHLRRALAALHLAEPPAARVRLDLLLSLGAALDHAGEAPPTICSARVPCTRPWGPAPGPRSTGRCSLTTSLQPPPQP